MTKRLLLLSICLLPLLTSSCVTTKGGGGAMVGAAGGAIAGQAIGHNTGSTLIGAAVGSMLGYMVGNEMDKNDQARFNQVYETSPSNQTTEWVNPDTGNGYRITPQPAFVEPRSHRQCRKAEVLTTINGRAEKVMTTACRENGRWVMQ